MPEEVFGCSWEDSLRFQLNAINYNVTKNEKNLNKFTQNRSLKRIYLQEMLKVASSFRGRLQLFSSTMPSLDTVGSAKYPQKNLWNSSTCCSSCSYPHCVSPGPSFHLSPVPIGRPLAQDDAALPTSQRDHAGEKTSKHKKCLWLWNIKWNWASFRILSSFFPSISP